MLLLIIELRFFLTLKKAQQQVSGERLIRYYTKFDFTVDEGKERLNPSREKKLRQAPQKEGGEILCGVTFLLGDPGWYVHKPDV